MKSQKGVTTIELLIVIVVISIIALFGSITVSEVIDSTRKKGFVGSGISFVEASRLSHAANEPFWDDDIATFREILNMEYVAKLGNDPWGGSFDLDESYVIYDPNDNFTPYKLRMVTNQATLGFEEALGDFDKEDVIVLGSAGGNIFERVMETFTGDLTGAFIGGAGHDLVEIGDDLQGTATIDTKDGNDIITIADDVKGNSSIVTGAGDDHIVMDGEIRDNANVSMGDGNDILTVDDDIQNNAVVTTGDGNDIVTVNDDVQYDAVLDTGDGNDTITVNDDVDGSNINAGSGDDSLTIDRIRRNANVDLGTGNDVVMIRDISSTYEGTLLLGEGDDTITLLDPTGGSSDLRGTDGTFDGGSGYDILNLPHLSLQQWNSYASELFSNFEEVNLEDTIIYP